MAQQTIDVGTTANDGTGDPIRDAFVKCNANFDELYGASGGADAYILPFFFTSTPTDSELLFIHVAGADFSIPADFASALQSYVGINPTATFDLDIAQNGTSIGTISVSTGGVVTATTTSGTAKTISAGDRLTATGPATADATAADMAFTIQGVR